jgi:hypothetical protein
MTHDPCPVGPDTLRNLDAQDKRGDLHEAAMKLLRDDFVRTLCDDPAGRIDVPDARPASSTYFRRHPFADIVHEMMDDPDHATRRVDILRVLAYAYLGRAAGAKELAAKLVDELATAHATDCVDAQVANMSNPD